MIKTIAKKIAKSIVPEKARQHIHNYGIFFGRVKGTSWKEIALNGKLVYAGNSSSDLLDYARQFRIMANSIKFSEAGRFIYPFDTWKYRLLPPGVVGLASITVDFGKVIDSNLNEIKKRIKALPESEFKQAELSVISSLEKLAFRIGKKSGTHNTSNEKRLGSIFPGILYRKPDSLEEALQKLLFYNAMFWQMRHLHIGLGRLDKILYPYYTSDVEKGKIDYEGAKVLLLEFCKALHKDYYAKSAGLLGDTGQYILLGGVTADGLNVDNDITRMFLELFAEHPMADPKLIIRVNSKTSDEIWRLSVNSIIRGSGSPLLMNEEVIMRNMKEFGYAKEDITELGTSACWEPLIIGKSFDQNNPFISASALSPVIDVVMSGNSYGSFDELLSDYETAYKEQFKGVIKPEVNFDCSPLFSLFFDECIHRNKDFSRGGAVYAFHGVQVVGLPNTVNALLNIKKFVFDDKLITLDQLRKTICNNFEGAEDIRQLLLGGEDKFGKCSEEVIELTNRLMDDASSFVSKLQCNGQPLKVGFSSPNYVWQGSKTKASPDGRKDGEPLAVHISPVSSDIDISEILDFATRLNYSGNRLNGNVVDFILPSAYIDMPDKLATLLKSAVERGLFEIQLNVLDKETLVDAKKHPEKHPDLIVRVWGFSAYFNDLPESFKDNLIARAYTYERN